MYISQRKKVCYYEPNCKKYIIWKYIFFFKKKNCDLKTYKKLCFQIVNKGVRYLKNKKNKNYFKKQNYDFK
jgi:hypothetical protein